MSAADGVARMLTLVPWLRQRPGASLSEIAAAFGVDAATVREDLEHLDFCGLPGLGGGALFDVTIVGDRVVVAMADELSRPLRPTAAEALRLVLLVDAVEAVLGDEVPHLRTAAAKLRGGLGVPERVADVLDADEHHLVDGLRAAARARRRVRFQYQKRTAARPEPRHIEPWAVHLVEGAWYVHGHDLDRDAGRAFRLDRASDLIVTDEPAVHPVPDTLVPPRYVPGEGDVDVVLELAPGGRWLLDAVEADAVEDRADGTSVVRLRTDAPEWLARLVVMAGGSARVVAPDELATAVRIRAARGLAALRAGRPGPPDGG